ncbi:hypothetical protein [Rhodoferax sp.]|uniref:hypothetical protein n=1 Tax=Rhodoferax sp. TaxID=50421 RepID=UPI002748417B|nr:hypothetical protein [Rhodoferax sp.]
MLLKSHTLISVEQSNCSKNAGVEPAGVVNGGSAAAQQARGDAQALPRPLGQTVGQVEA